MKITIGAPKSEVTAEILISIGANMTLASRSLNIQKTEPARKEAGISNTGLEDPSDCLIRKGTAIPIKETGPAKAVTQADRRLEMSIMSNLQLFTSTPTLPA